MNNLELAKSVPSAQWGEFFDQFSDSNRGQRISIKSIDLELGDRELIHGVPLIAMVYGCPGKGDDLVIEVGQNEVNYAHTVDSPTEVLTREDPNGLILTVWINDAAGTKTLIELQAD
jgi:hypothetical protein